MLYLQILPFFKIGGQIRIILYILPEKELSGGIPVDKQARPYVIEDRIGVLMMKDHGKKRKDPVTADIRVESLRTGF